MADSCGSPEDGRAPIQLKLPRAAVSRTEPWKDDALDRSKVAETLTSLLRTQFLPFSISIHGHWGTGKTFLLQRWERDLETQGFQALYFNAWEDDFCDDPLLAILGQLSDHFKESSFNRLVSAAMSVAGPLFRQTAQTLVSATTGHSIDLQQAQRASLLDQYLDQRKTKDDLKERLAALAEAVNTETGYPLVFIIDELDRCRPTFAIELLERVKHIFDVKYMVFVFGLNRSELAVSLRSIYGDIDSEVYLRRFFDIEFSLPKADGASFCRHVMYQYGLGDHFAALSSEANYRVHTDNYRMLSETLPEIWSRYGLSLRDIENCISLIAFVARKVRMRHNIYPAMLALLIPTRLKKRSVYDSFVREEMLSSEFINYVDEIISLEPVTAGDIRTLDWIEAHFYFAQHYYSESLQGSDAAISQLRLLAADKEPTRPKLVSDRARGAGRDRVSRMLDVIDSLSRYHSNGHGIVRYIASLLDLSGDVLER